MRTIRKVIAPVLLAVALVVGLTSAASAAYIQPTPAHFEHQNTTLTYVFHPSDANPGKVCTFQVQFGQYGGAAYVQTRQIPYYSNTPCYVEMHMGYNSGTGAQEYVYSWGGSDWSQAIGNPAFFLSCTFLVVSSQYGTASGYWYVGDWSYT